MRALRRLGLLIAILAVLFASANVLAERVAEDLVADGVVKEFDLQTRPEVDLAGFPILLRALRGDLPDVRFTVRDLVAEDLHIRSLAVSLASLRGVGSLFSGPYAIEVGEGGAEVVVAASAVNSYLRAHGEDATVTIGTGRVVVRTTVEFRGRRAVVASATVRLRGNTVRITPIASSITVDGEPAPRSIRDRAIREATVSVELPELPGGVRPTALDLVRGEVRMTATLDGRSITVR